MENKKEFMFLFRFEPTNDYQPTETEMAEQHQAWGAFIGNIAIQERLVSTHQLGFAGKQILADGSVTEGINVLANQMLGGNMIVRANDLDHAAEMAKRCPILHMGGTVEVRDVVPM
jgi:hypothetical protein